MSHILNGCCAYRGMYIARHDRIVDLIVKAISNHFPPPVKMYKHSSVNHTMFHLCNNPATFTHIPANTPDVVVVDDLSKEVFLLEVGCAFDPSLEEAFMTKVIKYQPLLGAISELGYRCRLLVFIFGSLGHAHRLVTRGLQLLGMPKRGAKQLAKFCSISAIIGSRHIWRRHCLLYP